MDELTLHPDPAAPVAREYQRPAHRMKRGKADPKIGPAPIPASDPAVVGASPRIYAHHFPSNTTSEIARGIDCGAARYVCAEQRRLGSNYYVWAEHRSRRMILPR